jgi:ketosteroid isomerase-like protein
MRESEGMQPRGNHSEDHLQLVRRQIAVWETNCEDASGFDDWWPDGVLTAPRGVRVFAPDIATVINGWHQLFANLSIELTSLFASVDGTWLALEWTWNVTRSVDGATSSTPDAIVVELREGKIASWREYFDTFGSVEFEPAGSGAFGTSSS